MGVVVVALAVVLSVVEVATQVVDSGLDDSMRTMIVSRHNMLRSRVRASNMLELRWSAALEREAAAWVDKCVFAHQIDPVWGENIFRSNFDQPVLNIMYSGLSAWDLESSFVRADLSCCDPVINSTLCCSYSQMVWATSREVGCALKRCAQLVSNTVDKDTWFMACYYSPAGNAPSLTATPYAKHPDGACAECPFSYSVCKNNLCTPSTWCTGNP